MPRRIRPAALIALALAAPAAPAAEAEQAIIVLDGSGSMWGQIDGKPKLEIARETLAAVLADTPPDLALGLLAYGHRRKGDCGDIELVVPPAPGTAREIAGAAAGMKFLGMTPISASVARAAEALRFTERKATVVLITDGLETCDADPCALGRELEQSGVDFTAHVVGFGLSAEEGKQVACLAEATGGRYFAANDAAALASALTETVVEAPPPVPPPPAAALSAPEQVPMSSRFTVGWQGPGARYDEVQVFDPAADGGRGRVVDRQRVLDGPGAARREATLVAPARPGEYTLRYLEAAHSRIIARRPLAVVEAAVSLQAPAEVAIAASFEVAWTGPGERYDEVQVFDPAGNGGRGKVIDQKRLADAAGGPVALVAPAEPGEYQLRYWNGDNASALATRTLRVVAAEVALRAPASVPMAGEFTVGWTGPGARYDEVQVFDPAGNGGRGKVTDRKRVGDGPGAAAREVVLVAPPVPGPYRLRYYNGDNSRVLHEQALEVAAIPLGLSAPAGAPAGQRLVVGWTGPGARYDEVQLFDPAGNGGRGQVLVHRRVRDDAGFARREVTLALPARPGQYQLRYYNGHGSAVLHSQPFAVQ